jgi:hypothetical protein
MLDPKENTARLATLERIRETTASAYLDPVPTTRALRALFDAAEVPRFKPRPDAKRGGGTVYYSVPHVERLFKNRTLPGGAMARLRTLPQC